MSDSSAATKADAQAGRADTRTIKRSRQDDLALLGTLRADTANALWRELVRRATGKDRS